MSLASTQFSSERDSRREQLLALLAKEARLKAELDGSQPEFPPEVQAERPEFVAQELADFNGRRARHLAELSVVESQLQQRTKEAEDTRVSMKTAAENLENARAELAIVTRMVERGLEPRLELLRVQGRVSELVGRYESARIAIPRLEAAIEEIMSRKSQIALQFRADVSTELGKTLVDLRTTQRILPALMDKVDRTEIRAPVAGILNRVLVTTIGGVVKAGETIAEIVPEDEHLVIETRVRTQDIGFLKAGLPVKVKITAYDYSIYGTMNGTLTQIGADAIPSEDRSQPNTFFFLARVETTTRALVARDRRLPVIPGMQAQVEIITGNRSVLAYLSKPLIAVRENAFRER